MDDNGSEEDYSYEDICQANPRYLQPGGEQLAINEVLESHTTMAGLGDPTLRVHGRFRLGPLDSFLLNLFPDLEL